MPELPDIVVYIESLRSRIEGRRCTYLKLWSPFVLRSVEPPAEAIVGRPVRSLRRLGKRIVIEFEQELFFVIHLMIAGRLRWIPDSTGLSVSVDPAGTTGTAGRTGSAGTINSGGSTRRPAGKLGLVSIGFDNGTLVLTEAGSKRRAWIQLVQGETALFALDPGGLEVLEADLDAFARVLTSENHTLKRSLTDPRLFSGIGNSFSDEILHRARLSPFQLTGSLHPTELEDLYNACRSVLTEWTDRLRRETGDGFPEKVTAFREGMAVHGRFRRPCPVCGQPVQRIVYAENEANYCAQCQTGGRILADRSLSRLLKGDWPRKIEDLEEDSVTGRRLGAGKVGP